MNPQTSKMLIGAVVAAALAFAVYFGLIGQQTANNIQTQTNQALGTAPAGQQPGATVQQAPTSQAPVPAGPVAQPPGQPARQ